MANRTRNITIDQGTDYTETFTVYEKPPLTTKMTLSAFWYANAQIRQSSTHKDSILTFGTVVNDTNKTVTLTANNLVTSKVKEGRYLYEIVLVKTTLDPDQKIRIQEGIATIAPSVEFGSMYTTNSTGGDGSSGYT
jgi:hypothetical protein